MDKTSKITLASIIAFVALALTFFACVPSHVSADNSAPNQKLLLRPVKRSDS